MLSAAAVTRERPEFRHPSEALLPGHGLLSFTMVSSYASKIKMSEAEYWTCNLLTMCRCGPGGGSMHDAIRAEGPVTTLV